MRKWKWMGLAVVAGCLTAGTAQAQKHTKITIDRAELAKMLNAPAEIRTGALPLGTSDVVRNSAGFAGAAPFGIAEDAGGTLYVGELFAGSIFTYDKDLNLLGSIPSPAPGTTTGLTIANGSLYVVDGFPQGGGSFTETDPGTGLPTGAGTQTMPVVDGTQLCGPLAYDVDADTLWCEDIVTDLIFEFDFSGSLTGRSFFNPDAVGFGNGLSAVELGPLATIGVSLLDITSGTGAEGQVTRISRGNPAAGTPTVEIKNLIFVGDSFINGIVTSTNNGVPVHFLVGNDTNSVIEIGPPAPIVGCGPGTVNAGTPPAFFSDDMESGDANWTHSSAPDPNLLPDDWAIIATGNACSVGSAWFSADANSIKDVRLDSIPLLIPGSGAALRFSHVFNMEANFDGCVLEASVDGGAFTDLGPQIVQGNYTGTISLAFSSPIAGQEAWTDTAGPPCEDVLVDLTPFAGSTVVIRFRLCCDSSVSDEGWYVDDVRISEPGGGQITNVLFVNRAEADFCDDMEDLGGGPGASLLCDDIESGDGNFTHSALDPNGLADDWGIIVTGNASSPSNAWFSEDESGVKDVALELNSFAIPAGGAELSFQHFFNMESGFDGCVLEGSTDGVSYVDLEGDITLGGYTGSISSAFSSPIGGQNAWTGSNGATSEVKVDLSGFAGQSVIIRWRLACDSSVSGEGWYIDDVKISEPALGGGSADNFMTSSPTGNGDWNIVTHGGSNSPTHSWFSSDISAVKDDYLDLNEFTVTSSGDSFSFFHNYNMETNFDGCVLEASLNGGAFFDLESDIVNGGYDAPISSAFMSPIGGRNAWTGSNGLPQTRVEVDLSPYIGNDIVIRWRLACDSSVSGEGWYIDDVKIGGNDGTGGDARIVCLGQADPLCIELDAAPSGPANPLYVFYAHLGEPDINTTTEQPFGVGQSCMPSVISGGVPQPAFILNKLGRFNKLGFSSIPQGNVPCAPGVLLKKNSGVGFPVTFTIQAIIQDTFSLGDQPLTPSSDKPGSVTNAIIVKVQ